MAISPEQAEIIAAQFDKRTGKDRSLKVETFDGILIGSLTVGSEKTTYTGFEYQAPDGSQHSLLEANTSK